VLSPSYWENYAHVTSLGVSVLLRFQESLCEAPLPWEVL